MFYFQYSFYILGKTIIFSSTTQNKQLLVLLQLGAVKKCMISPLGNHYD